MSDVTWQNIETIIDGVLARPESERAGYIEQACADDKQLKGEVTRLLESIFDSRGWLENPEIYKADLYAEIAGDVDQLDQKNTFIGSKVGAYTVKEQLGEGGMGSVYRAERSDGTFEHQVAIKVIRSGRSTPENIRRFERERNILAGLSHPGIAQLFDGGITDDGVPYLIMEHIDGVRIDQYCRDNKLSLDQKIELFQKVLQAVQHAHEALVIHRDLKPGNILVTPQGQVKILDFGISKLLEDSDQHDLQETLTKGRILTPKYAAPEQIREEPITTATDLFALGTIFYELLTEQHPLDMDGITSHHQIERVILEQAPSAPSTKLLPNDRITKKQLRGDLNAIALKAIRKEPERRYRTANNFLDDLDNYKQGLPVTAHTDSLQYRSRKFLNRHAYRIAAAAGFLLLIIAFTILHTSRITQERNNARLEAEKATQITNLLSGILQQSNPFSQPNRDITLAEVLDDGTRQIQNGLEDQPQIKAELLGLLGDNYASLGNFSKGEELLENALSLYSPSELESVQQTYINNLSRLGMIYHRTGRFQQAESSYLKALEFVKRQEGEESANAGALYNNLALTYREQGKLLKTEQYYKKAIAIADSTQKLSLATAVGNLANAYRDQGAFERAIDLHEQSLRLEHEVRDTLHPNLASAYNGLAFTYQQKGDYPTADSLHQIALKMRRQLFPSDHHHIASSLIRLGLLKIKQMHTREAETLLEEGYEILSQKFPEEHWQVISAKGGLAVSRAMQGKFEENVPIVEEAYQKFNDRFGAKDWRTREAALALANLYRAWGKPDKANYYSSKE